MRYVIIRGASNYDGATIAREPGMPDVWVTGANVTEDISSGYTFAIGTTSTAVLNLFRVRCEQDGGAAASCAFTV